MRVERPLGSCKPHCAGGLPPRICDVRVLSARLETDVSWLLLSLDNVVARDGIEPPTPAFSGLVDQPLTQIIS
jgi:hypothetical protein